MSKKQALYRFFDGRDELLYLGITTNLPVRLTQHRSDKRWWTEVSRIQVEHWPDRGTALKKEKEAIKREGPRYNVIHNGEAEKAKGAVTENRISGTVTTKSPDSLVGSFFMGIGPGFFDDAEWMRGHYEDHPEYFKARKMKLMPDGD